MTPISSWNGQIPADVLIDSGVLYVASSIWAAQEGGIKFDPGISRKQIAFDGQRSPIAGLDRTTSFKPVISASVMEIPQASFSQLEPGATLATITGGPTGATQVQPKSAGVLYAAGDYIANLRAVWQRTDGTFFQIRFPKALCTKWDVAGKDKEEGKWAVSFEARLDMSVGGQLVSNPPYVVEYFATGP